MGDKICSKCHLKKEAIEYHKDKYKADGLKSCCKSCQKSYSKAYYMENKENLILKSKNVYANLSEEQYDKIKIRNRNITRNKDKKEISLINKKYNIENRDKIKKHYNKNKDSINARRRKAKRENKLLHLKSNIRTLIWYYINRSGHKKKTNTENILGINYIMLKEYLESGFESWMTWENYGKYNGELNYGWDIDHIIPVSFANTEEDVYKLNHYTNLQPLCSKVNRDIKKDNIVNE